MRKAVFAVSLTAVMLLASCASTPEASPIPAGDSSNAVSVSTGSKPNIEVPTPLRADSLQCSQIIPGSGSYAKPGEMVNVEIAIYNGSTGELIQQTAWDGSDTQNFVLGGELFEGLSRGLECAREGSRIVLTVPPALGFGDAGSPNLGIGPNDTIVFVMDVNRIYLAKANGVPQLSQDGMPMVVLAPNGQPGVSVPDGEAPGELRVSTLKRGSGATVAAGDQVTMHYSGLLWADGSQFDSSWNRGTPLQVIVGNGAESTIIPGLSQALIGQTVGSQVLVVIPPELAYGEQATASIPAGSTLVFVVDILGVD